MAAVSMTTPHPAGQRRRMRWRMVNGVEFVLAAAVLVGLMSDATCQNADFMTHPCGLRFRIATHTIAPFMMLDKAKCTNQRCPPEAFIGDGGLTYEFMMKHLLPKLVQQCKDLNAPDPNIEFEWYLPKVDLSSASSSVNMACRGGWDEAAVLDFKPGVNTTCPSNDPTHANYYLGPSRVGTCSSLTDPTCVSKGPDMVAGAVHVLTERLMKLQFTGVYYSVAQSVVTRLDNSFDIIDGILNVFRCFDVDLYIGIAVEIFAVWLMFMIVEANVNDDICDGWGGYYDTFYWVFSGVFGGADKAPITIGGKIIFCAHSFFALMIIASYTGAVAAFLTAQAAVPKVVGFSSLEQGSFSVVVRGPKWDAALNPAPYRGRLIGSNSQTSTLPSSQFDLLQGLMSLSSDIQFSMVTTQRMESRLSDGVTPLKIGKDTDPCAVSGAILGAYDMVACGTRVSTIPPDTLIYDTPSVIYEINSRKNATGKCDLVTVGPPFDPSGFGIAFPYHTTFNIAFDQAIFDIVSAGGVIENLEAKYGIGTKHNDCEQEQAAELAMTINEMMGLFVVTGGLIALALGHGIFERRAHAREEAEAERQAEEDAMVMDVAKGGDGLDDDEPLAVPHLLSDKEVDYIEKEAELAGVPSLQKRVREIRGQMSRLEEMGQQLVESLSNKE